MSVQSSQELIDEGLYSRQLYVLGREAMQKMSSSNVLIIGLKGLGVEVAKNVILAGVKSVTLYDPEPTALPDLSNQFFLREEDVGTPRAQASAARLAELNQYVPVHVLTEELTPEVIQRFKVIVATETPLARMLEINQVTHAAGNRFIATDIRGLFGHVFCDFGPEFLVSDPNGEEPVSGMIAAISREADGVVTCLDETRHGLEDGDFVTFSEVQGMTDLNGGDPRPVKVIGPYTFSIGDTSGLPEYERGGLFQQVKMPKVYKFKPLAESLLAPELMVSDFAKFDRPAQLHLAFQALDRFSQAHSGRLPRPRDDEDADAVLALTKELAAVPGPTQTEVSDDLIRQFAYGAAGQLSPMAAFFGGIVGQEVLKACSGKFGPVMQHLYFDSLESLPTEPLTKADCQPMGSRYDGQIAVFGRAFQAKLADQRQFLVGAGAIGCEMLKNWAMMGLGTGPRGEVHVTDMDTIEKSNLNRQFLFRPSDVGHLKSDTAIRAVAVMNPDTVGHIVAHQDRVGPETERVYNDDFFEALDGVTNALDNVEARRYMDRRCVYYRKPLLESGTLGTKGNTQVVLPFLTESYSSSQDPPEKTIPVCTLHNFPNVIAHTIQWARDRFEGLFHQAPENVNLYLTQPGFLEAIAKQGANEREVVLNIKELLVDEKPRYFEECVQWARLKFEKYFSNDIKQLLYNFPADAVTSSGQRFWTAPKRAPTPLTFDAADPLHLDFITSAANLYAAVYGLKAERDPATIRAMVTKVEVPEFVPKQGVKIQVQENEPAPTATGSEGDTPVQQLASELPAPSTLSGVRLHPLEFEKDDDTNFHIDFIAAASNLRAANYSIKPADRLQTKFIAGKIIPAIATTTALVTGLVCLELLKIVGGHQKLEDYKNGFINLALPFFGFSEPIPAQKLQYHETEFSLWDRFDVQGGDMTLQEFLDYFQREHGLEVTMLSSGVSMLYSFFMPKKKLDERKAMKMSQLVETVSKKPIPSHVKAIVLEICANDRDDEDVEVPYVRLVIR